MVIFSKLEDSPIFRKQLVNLEKSSESLKDRCQKFEKNCRKYMVGIGESQRNDLLFIDSLESFHGGPDDMLGEAIGGPVMVKFISALRDIACFKEVLKKQVEHMLVDRLNSIVSTDIHGVKEVRKRFDKASHNYDQARDRFLSLKKDARPDMKADLEEAYLTSKAHFEQSRFNLVAALSNIESKKRFEFLDAVSAYMAAQLRYFKQSFELLKDTEPYILQVVGYVEQAKERAQQDQAELAERLQQFRREHEETALALSFTDSAGNLQPAVSALAPAVGLSSEEPALSSGHSGSSAAELAGVSSGSTDQTASTSPSPATAYDDTQRQVQTIMEEQERSLARRVAGAGAGGAWLGSRPLQVVVIKQGYLLKRSSSLRHDWQRRFFVLDARGELYYYRTSTSAGGAAATSAAAASGGKLLSHSKVLPQSHPYLWKSSPAQAPRASEGSVNPSPGLMSSFFGFGRLTGRDTAGVRPNSTQWSTLMDDSRSSTPGQSPPREKERSAADQQAVREEERGLSCHSIPLLTATLKMDGDSDLSFCFRLITPAKTYTLQAENESERRDWSLKITAVISSLLTRHLAQPTLPDGGGGSLPSSQPRPPAEEAVPLVQAPLALLQLLPGNQRCADCGAASPDWASLNLCVLLCINCSGLHRRLGVHLSRVRSTTLDVRAWDQAVLAHFQAMGGNTAVNSIWVQRLPAQKPLYGDSLEGMEKLVRDKYEGKKFVAACPLSVAALRELWLAVAMGDTFHAGRLVVSMSAPPAQSEDDGGSPLPLPHAVPAANITLEMAAGVEMVTPLSLEASPSLKEQAEQEPAHRHGDTDDPGALGPAPIVPGESAGESREGEGGTEHGLDGENRELCGCTLLHLACRRVASDQRELLGMVEMLLQNGAHIGARDLRGRTALHHCVIVGNALVARLLIARGAAVTGTDVDGKTALDLAIEFGRIADHQLFLLLTT